MFAPTVDGRMDTFRAILIALLVLVLTALPTTACDPGHAVTYDNRMDIAITILLDGQVEASLEPMQRKTLDLIEFDNATFEARDSAGTVLYRETLTWAELKQRGWKIVITGAAPGSTPRAPVGTTPGSPSPQ